MRIWTRWDPNKGRQYLYHLWVRLTNHNGLDFGFKTFFWWQRHLRLGLSLGTSDPANSQWLGPTKFNHGKTQIKEKTFPFSYEIGKNGTKNQNKQMPQYAPLLGNFFPKLTKSTIYILMKSSPEIQIAAYFFLQIIEGAFYDF